MLVGDYDGTPVAKVIDFGVAKATEQHLTADSLLTRHGQVVGTLEYMSPEQADSGKRDVDTRSDVYSLGVLLYELLTGTTPFTRAQLRQVSLAELLRIICEQEPEKPSTRLSDAGGSLSQIASSRRTEPRRLTALIRGDLDWIVLKALEKDPANRYDTPSGFAADLRRFLNDEIVLAQPSAAYRLSKFVRKNKAAVAGFGVFVALLVFGLSFSWWQLSKVRRAQTAERLAHRDSERRYELARNAVELFGDRVISSPELRQHDLFDFRKRLLEGGIEFYEKLVEEQPQDKQQQESSGRCVSPFGPAQASRWRAKRSHLLFQAGSSSLPSSAHAVLHSQHSKSVLPRLSSIWQTCSHRTWGWPKSTTSRHSGSFELSEIAGRRRKSTINWHAPTITWAFFWKSRDGSKTREARTAIPLPYAGKRMTVKALSERVTSW